MNGTGGDPTPEDTIPFACYCTQTNGVIYFTIPVDGCIEDGEQLETEENCVLGCDAWWQDFLDDPETTCFEEIGSLEAVACGVVAYEACTLEGPSSGCGTFDPSSYITSLGGGKYGVDFALVGQVVSDQALLHCGGQHFDARVGEGFTLDGAGSGDMFYELGLRNGDIPLTLNGMELDSFSEVAWAFAVLWLIEGEMDYTLIVERSSSPLTLQYEIYLTSP